MKLRSLFARLREYVTMARSLAPDRASASRAVAAELAREARQKRDAAEVLLLRGSPAEALRLGVESLERLRRALTTLEEAGATRSPGMQRAVARVERLGATVGPVPELDAAVAVGQPAALRDLLRAELALAPWLDVELLDRRGILRLRRQRWVLLALALVVAPAAAAAFVRSALRGIHVRGSSALDEEYTADRAMDGDPDTEWVPAGTGEEWLELRFPARRIQTVSVLNGDTLPDRASKEIHLECYLHGDLYPAGARTFQAQYPAGWVDFDGAGILCERLRIVVTSHYGTGGAIAEVQVR